MGREGGERERDGEREREGAVRERERERCWEMNSKIVHVTVFVIPLCF